jgi:hypothetical protein
VSDGIPIFQLNPEFRTEGTVVSVFIENVKKKKNTLPLLGFLGEGSYGSVMGPLPTINGCDGFLKIYPLIVHSIKGRTKLQPNHEIKTFRQLKTFKENYSQGLDQLRNGYQIGWRAEYRIGAPSIIRALHYLENLQASEPESAFRLIGVDQVKEIPVRVYMKQAQLVRNHMFTHWRQRDSDLVPQGFKKAVIEAMNFLGFGSPFWFFLRYGISVSRWLGEEDVVQERLFVTEEDQATDAIILEDAPLEETSSLEQEIFEQLEWRQNPNRRMRRVHVVSIETGRFSHGFETALAGAKFVAETYPTDWMERFRRKEEYIVGPQVVVTAINQGKLDQN